MNADASNELTELESRWSVRERQWARSLGRLRLRVEPLEEQLTRLRRTTWALTVVPGIIALFVLTLFTVIRPARHRVGRDLDPVRADDALPLGGLREAQAPGRRSISRIGRSSRRREKGCSTLRCRRRVPERDETFTSLWDLMIRKGRHRLLLGQVCAFKRHHGEAWTPAPTQPDSSSSRSLSALGASPSVHSSASATEASSSSRNRLRAVCSLRLMVPRGTSSSPAISTSDRPRM